MGELFRPFRALGYITDDVPFAVQRRGKETYVTVSVGRTWQARFFFCVCRAFSLLLLPIVWLDTLHLCVVCGFAHAHFCSTALHALQ
jgi:hypothetical protein